MHLLHAAGVARLTVSFLAPSLTGSCLASNSFGRLFKICCGGMTLTPNWLQHSSSTLNQALLRLSQQNMDWVFSS